LVNSSKNRAGTRPYLVEKFGSWVTFGVFRRSGFKS